MAVDAFGIVSGYVAVTLVISVGYLLRRTGLLDQVGETSINGLGLFVATPALYIVVLIQSKRESIVSDYAIATALALLACLAVSTPLIRLASPRRPWRETALIAASTINPNSGNIGIPISIAALGSAAPLAPVIIIQVAVLSPVIMMVLELTDGRRGAVRAILRRAFVNPMAAAAVVGVAFALSEVTPPEPIMSAFELVGGAAIPLLLLAFGSSLYGARPLALLRSQPLLVILAVAAKSVLLPVIAIAVGTMMGLGSDDLLALAIVASLPIAQNVYAMAHAYDADPPAIRTIVVISTLASLPLALAFAAFLSP